VTSRVVDPEGHSASQMFPERRGLWLRSLESWRWPVHLLPVGRLESEREGGKWTNERSSSATEENEVYSRKILLDFDELQYIILILVSQVKTT
jgi:hypothetical protein